MIKKIKSLVYASFVGVMLFPVTTFAQWSPPGTADTGLQSTALGDIIQALMKWLLYIVGFLAIIAFVISAILYLTSAGDDTKTEKAKNAMIAGIIGVIVALIGLIIINAISTWFGGVPRF